jgi:Zn-dependent peptidase ImmA (M78 family)
MPRPIAEHAEGILRSLNMWKVPVNPLDIARQEGILLKEGAYSDGFDARIEYYADHHVFCIFYAQSAGWRTEGRVRFSLSHELGHYFIEEHRQLLLKGKVHDSVSDFRSRDPIEIQADEFAADLLMPMPLFRAELDRFRSGLCTLDDLSTLATRLGTSLTSVGRRYCESDREPCTILFSDNGLIRWSHSSEDMKRKLLYFYPYNNAPPHGSKTAALWEMIHTGTATGKIEGSVAANVWFDMPRARYLWEEARPLGNTGRVITQLTIES